MAVIVGHAGGDEGTPRGDRDRLLEFRQGWYRCLTRWADTLFEVTDAVLTAPGAVASLPYLSLEPALRRGWGSVYASLSKGRVETAAVHELLIGALPGWWPVFAVDVTPWPRPEAGCSPRRGMCRVPDPGGQRRGRMVPGWAYQWICQVSATPDSWTAPVDVVRVDPDDNATEVACDQMSALIRGMARHQPGVVPVFCLDAGYCPITATARVASDPGAPARIIGRIRRDRVFYGDPPAKTPGSGGRPKLHGDRFACADPTTWPDPTHELRTVDDTYGPVHVQAWAGLHPKPSKRRRWAAKNTKGLAAPIIRGTLVRISLTRTVEAGTGQTLWLWTAGPDPINLDLIWRAYLRRFAIEHTNRFIKQHLAWTTPALRHPDQADLWTWIVAAAYTQLRLARTLIADQRLPWERPLTPATLTPYRVRRGFRSLHPHLPTPARPPKPSRPGPGRPKGSRNQQRAPRHKTIIKRRQPARR